MFAGESGEVPRTDSRFIINEGDVYYFYYYDCYGYGYNGEFDKCGEWLSSS